MFDDLPDLVEGEMTITSNRKNTSQPGQPDFNTLDEPIRETVVSDFVETLKYCQEVSF